MRAVTVSLEPTSLPTAGMIPNKLPVAHEDVSKGRVAVEAPPRVGSLAKNRGG